MGRPVELTPSEILIGATVGILREIENVKKGRKQRHGADDQGDWQKHIEGALGEMALAKDLGIYWTGKGVLREPDVGEVDVRTTGAHTHRLILHEDDPDDRRFWLVTGMYGSYVVQGYILGADGKNPQWWKDPTGGGRAAYFVPQYALTL